MSKIVPSHIKENFVYRRCYNNIWRKDMNVCIIIVGNPGLGKSRLAQRIAMDLDPSFHIGRICYSVKDFMKIIYHGTDEDGALRAGQAVVFDEIVTDEGADARAFMSKGNRMLASVIATFRAKRLITIFCLPKLKQLDINVRDIGLTGLFVAERRTGKYARYRFYWGELDALTGIPLRTYPRVNRAGSKVKVKAIWVGKKYDVLWKEYLKKKHSFLNNLGARYYREITAVEQKKREKLMLPKLSFNEMLEKVKSNSSEFLHKGKIASALIRAKFGIGENSARDIAIAINASRAKIDD